MPGHHGCKRYTRPFVLQDHMPFKSNRNRRAKKQSRPVQLAVIVAAVAAAVFAWGRPDVPAEAVKDDALQCTVSSVHDGDSMRARCPGHRDSVRVRIDQIDAPELDQKHGIASRDVLRQLCPTGEPVQLYVMGKDQYERLLADVSCNGKDVATTMVTLGAAWVYTKYVRDDGLLKQQKQAQASRAGIWNDNDPTAPWQFRQAQRQ